MFNNTGCVCYYAILIILTSSFLWEGSCLIYVICVSLRIVVSNTYCVVFFVVLCTLYVASFSGLFVFCLSSSCVPYVVSFSVLCVVFLRLVYPMLPVSLGCVVCCFSLSCVPYMLPVSLCCVLFFVVLCTLCYQFLWIVQF
jgi:hypothetical protein